MSTSLKIKMAVPSCTSCQAEDFGGQSYCTNCGAEWESVPEKLDLIVIRSKKLKFFSRSCSAMEQVEEAFNLLLQNGHSVLTITPDSWGYKTLEVSSEEIPTSSFGRFSYKSAEEAVLACFGGSK